MKSMLMDQVMSCSLPFTDHRQIQGASVENPCDRPAPAPSDVSTPSLDRCSSTISVTTVNRTSVSASPQLGPVVDGRLLEPCDQYGALVAGIGGILSGVDLDRVPEFSIEETGPDEGRCRFSVPIH
jgi:hypothetical protein